MHSGPYNPKTIAIVACPFRGGTAQTEPGIEDGPVHLVEAGLVGQLEGLGYKVHYDGQIQLEPLAEGGDPPIGKVKEPRFAAAACRTVSSIAGRYAKAGQIPITLAGDHSLAIGTISGTLEAHPNACVIWVDAQADINTPETTQRGNMSRMPVSFLMGIGEHIEEFEWLKGVLRPERLVYIGLRNVDALETRILRENGIEAFSMRDVNEHGIHRVMDMALDHVNRERDRPIHLSFDMNALDPSVAPSTNLPDQGGLTYGDGHSICEAIHKTGLLVALDLVDVNPSIGEAQDVQQTVEVGCSLIRTALGEKLL